MIAFVISFGFWVALIGFLVAMLREQLAEDRTDATILARHAARRAALGRAAARSRRR